jgi:hypothetical protein
VEFCMGHEEIKKQTPKNEFGMDWYILMLELITETKENIDSICHHNHNSFIKDLEEELSDIELLLYNSSESEFKGVKFGTFYLNEIESGIKKNLAVNIKNAMAELSEKRDLDTNEISITMSLKEAINMLAMMAEHFFVINLLKSQTEIIFKTNKLFALARKVFRDANSEPNEMNRLKKSAEILGFKTLNKKVPRINSMELMRKYIEGYEQINLKNGKVTTAEKDNLIDDLVKQFNIASKESCRQLLKKQISKLKKARLGLKIDRMKGLLPTSYDNR